VPPSTPVENGCTFSTVADGTREGVVSISESRKSKLGTPPIGSKNRRTQRRAVKAAMLYDHWFRVNASGLPRRRFLHLAGSAAALPAVSRSASAQTYPTRPVRLIVPFPAGGGVDAVARLMGQWLSDRLQQPFIIENRPGASTNLATEAVVRAPADGHTLGFIGTSGAINATLFRRLNFNLVRDIAPIAGLVRFFNVMEVSPSFPAKTVPEFIAYAKANPGKVTVATPGRGTTQHLSAELFQLMTGVTLVHVPYRGSAPALTDLIGGQVQVTFDAVPSSIEQIRTGKLRALAVTSATRLDVLADVPALSEFAPGFEASAWQGLGAPKSTPVELIERLNREINAGLTEPVIRTRLGDLGATPLALSPSAFGKLIADETEKWAKVIKSAGIKPE
jgi:tripartite-type tricarboxylate transporter receptor subunit TctC